MTRNHGYTLLEILLSLIVVVALSLVFVGTTKKIQQRSQIKVTALQMNSIINAAITYRQMYGSWPTTLAPLSTLLQTNLSCSAWQNSMGTGGCAPYTITSTAASAYFAVAVATPSTAIATRLAAQLPTAYQTGITVSAFTTTFEGFPAGPIPSGVLMSANNTQIHTTCYTGTGSPPMPFKNCTGTGTLPVQPYGLINIASQPLNTVVSQNVIARPGSDSGQRHIIDFSATETPFCPPGYYKTAIFIYTGFRTAVTFTATVGPTSGGYKLHTGNNYFYYSSYMGGYYGGYSTGTVNIVSAVPDITCLSSAPIASDNWVYV